MKQDTGMALVAAARRLFARHGYEGTSVRHITAAAHANLGAITYHFGSKRGLYEEVLLQATRPLADRVVAETGADRPFLERIANVVRLYFGYLIENSDMGRLMLQELALERAMPAPVVVSIRRIHLALTELVVAGQAAGELRAGDPRILAISIISQAVHMNLVRRALKEFAGLNLEDPATREAVIAEVTAFVCAGLAHESARS